MHYLLIDQVGIEPVGLDKSLQELMMTETVRFPQNLVNEGVYKPGSF